MTVHQPDTDPAMLPAASFTPACIWRESMAGVVTVPSCPVPAAWDVIASCGAGCEKSGPTCGEHMLLLLVHRTCSVHGRVWNVAGSVELTGDAL